MKNHLIIVLIIFSSIILTSCATVQNVVYLQEVEVNTPLSPPPIRITKDMSAGSVTLSPRILLSNYSEISGNAGTRKFVSSQQDSVFRSKNKNLFWKMPKMSFGFDLDIAVTDHVAFSGGINYSINNQRRLWGGSFAIGFYQEKNSNAVRFDAGLRLQEFYYEAKSIVEQTIDPIWGDPTTSVGYFFDQDRDFSYDLFLLLSYNSTMKEFPLNFFMNLGYFSQTILDFSPTWGSDILYSTFFLTPTHTEDARGEATISLLTATPGIFIDVTEWTRIIVGARFMYNIDFDSASRDLFILPVMQIDMHF